MRLSQHQFACLGILARKPKRYRLAWSHCGHGAYSTVDDPTGRNEDPILTIPLQWRWPPGTTIQSLDRRGLIRGRRDPTGIWTVYWITPAGLKVYAEHDAPH